MFEEAPLWLWEWASLALRWLHIVTAAAWIGSSFYFIALDLGLQKAPAAPAGVSGEAWQVHGGGFYHIQKYGVAPEALPARLTWFKWESYATWLSGFALLCVVYYAGAELHLIDPAVWTAGAPAAVALSLAVLAAGWIVYDLLCRSPLRRSPSVLMILLFGLLTALAWGLTHAFTGRAVMLHLGAVTATLMSANVFFVIIPNQKIAAADLKAGRAPDPRLGAAAKLRSVHNNYLTLPVLFLMLSNHYPLAFASRHNWIIAALVFLTGVCIRHFFNTAHAGRGRPYWTWAAAAALFFAAAWLSTAGPRADAGAPGGVSDMTPAARAFAAAPHFEAAADAVLTRCAACHAAEPGWDGVAAAPKGVLLETKAQIAAQAREIYLQAGITDAMPPANASYMEPAERALIIAWYETAAGRGN